MKNNKYLLAFTFALMAVVFSFFSEKVSANVSIQSITSTHQSGHFQDIESDPFSTEEPNTLLLAFITTDGSEYPDKQSISAIHSHDSDLEWTLVARANNRAGTSEVWKAVAEDEVTDVEAHAEMSDEGYWQGSITVVAFDDADTVIGATATASGSTGAASVPLTTTRNNSWVWAAGNDWDNATSRTVGSGQTKVDEFLTSDGDTMWIQRQNNLTATDGTLVTMNTTAPTNDQWNMVAVEVLSDADTVDPQVTLTTPSQNATVSGTVTVSATASDTVGVTRVEFYDEDELIATDSAAPYSVLWDTTETSTGTRTLTAKAFDAAGNVGTDAHDVLVVQRYSLWPTNPTPTNPSVNDTTNLELGVKFRPNVDGQILGVRYYKSASNTGTHVGNVWNESGENLATATFTSETSSGWQQVLFSTPVMVEEDTVYIASYHTTTGYYAAENGYFADNGVTNGPLYALKNGETGGNGVYKVTSSSDFPQNTFSATNYWVDIIFQPLEPYQTGNELHATTSNLATLFSNTTGGETIFLSTGNYGTFTGANKASMVTLKPEPTASASIALDFTPASNITIDGLNITNAELTNSTHDITIKNSSFSGAIKIDGVQDADILLDNNTHNNIFNNTSCTGSPARIHLPYSGETHSGVTIQNSLMDGGNTDGIQTGIGIDIINNEFRNIHERDSEDCAHTDTIQLIGAKGSLVKGNYIHHTAVGIVAYDGIEEATIEDNVIDLVNGRWGIELYSDTDSIVRHNTLVYRTTCSFSPCGHIILDHKVADASGSGTIVENNIAYAISENNGSTAAVNRYNMVITGATGTNFTGTPVYIGGSTPTTYAGFLLHSTSPGKGAASDSNDVGINP